MARNDSRLKTGIEGLDEILRGGFVRRRAYLIRGGPGTGKTTLGLHFLTTGARGGDPVLFLTLGEPQQEIRRNAATQGFDLEGVAFLDLSPTPELFAKAQTYDIFSPAEVERGPMAAEIVTFVEKVKPQRVFLDAITQFRYLAPDPFQFRKQMLSLLRFLVDLGATVLFTSESSLDHPDNDLQFLSDGVVELLSEEDSRTLRVAKFRGSDFSSGYHSFKLTERGIEVFPRLIPRSHRKAYSIETISSGVPDLDDLLQGGLERGTVTIISGPTGVGKTTLGMLFMKEAAQQGRRSVVYTFEEAVDVLLRRCEGISIPMTAMIDQEKLAVNRIEALQYSPDELARIVRQDVEDNDTRIVMLDSVAGYRLSLNSQCDDLVSHVHALCKYLVNVGVTVLLVVEVESITGEFRATEAGISYLADNIIFLRYVEMKAELRRVVGVLKKRLSTFEKTLREFEITPSGVKVGRPLRSLRGILGGSPEVVEVES